MSNDFLKLTKINLIMQCKSHRDLHCIFTSPHFHRFLLNKIAKIGENGGSRNDHAYNACKNQGVAQD